MNIRFSLFIILFLALSAHSIDYCEVEDKEVNLYIYPDEVQQLPLYKYVRGFNLDFETSDPKISEIYEPYHVIEAGIIGLAPEYVIVDIDGRDDHNYQWTKEGVILAQKGEKEIAIGYGEFTNTKLPEFQTFKEHELEYPSQCYTGQIFNNEQDVVIDCEKLYVKDEEMTDLICVYSKSGKFNCESFSSITKTNKRSSIIYSLNNNKFLFSASLTDNVPQGFENETFITVYYLTSESVEFNTVIDRRTLGLSSLSINDLDVIEFGGENYVVITDASGKIILFRFTEDGKVFNQIIVEIEGEPRQFDLGPEGTWLIATEEHVIEGSFILATSSLNFIRSYELDPSDNVVVDLQVSYLLVSIRTDKDQLYVYDRKLTDLKYLLNQEKIEKETALFVSSYSPRLFLFNNVKKSLSISITNGNILISKVKEESNVTITAKSNNITCSFLINIKLVELGASVVEKKKLHPNFRIENGAQEKFVLADYFEGSNLEYTVNSSSQDLSYSLEHIDEYHQNFAHNTEDNFLFSKILAIDEKSYWLAKVFSDKTMRFYLCSVKNGESICEEKVNETVQYSDRVKIAEFNFHKGEASFLWIDYGGLIWMKRIGKKPSGVLFEFGSWTQVLITQKYIVSVDRTMNLIAFAEDLIVEQNDRTIIDKGFFSEDQLKLLGGSFYPRAIYSSQSNPHIFYIKTPTSVVSVFFSNKRFEIISVLKVLDKYIPDDLWQIVIGKDTILVLTEQAIKEFIILTDSSVQLLHQIKPSSTVSLPAKYSQEVDSVYYEEANGNIQIVKLNQPRIGSEFFRFVFNHAKINSFIDWDISGVFFMPSLTTLYYQYPEPALVLSISVPEATNKEEINLQITVKNEIEEKNAQTKIVSYNYPSKVSVSDISDNGLSLPSTTTKEYIPIPLEKYFTGPIADYKLSCPYCSDGKISLVEPIIEVKKISELEGYSAIVELSDRSGAIVAVGTSLKLINSQGAVAVTLEVGAQGCSALALKDSHLIAFYKTTKSQALYHFEVSTSTIQSIKLKNTFLIEERHTFSFPSQIALHLNGTSINALVLDSNQGVVSSKNSFVKVFELGTNSLGYLGQINGLSFGLGLEPIQSIDVNGNHLVVALGKIGLGYVNLANFDYFKPQQIINLSNEPLLESLTLDDTNYLRVLFNPTETNSTNLQVFVATSNSYSYLLSLTVTEGAVKFGSALEVYNRYSHETSLNWADMNSKFVLLAFYNKTTSVQSLAVYRRSNATKVNFFNVYKVENTSVFIPKAALIETQNTPLLLISTPSATILNLTENFYLLANYDTPGNFTTITVTASNHINSVSKDLSVEFDNNITPEGLKWYSILIVIVLVAIGVGVAYGLFLRMKKRKQDSKKVSLFTENEEIDEKI